jgi:hypothetical protein
MNSKAFKNDKQLRSWLKDSIDEDSLGNITILDGLSPACIGIDIDTCEYPKLVYSINEIINILKSQGMDEHEAVEYYEYNIARLVGYTTAPMPILVQDFWNFI